MKLRWCDCPFFNKTWQKQVAINCDCKLYNYMLQEGGFNFYAKTPFARLRREDLPGRQYKIAQNPAKFMGYPIDH